MDTFVKATAGVLITVVLGLTLAKQGKDISLLLTVAVCCMILSAAMTYLQPVVSFLTKLQSVGNLDQELVTILMKAAGIGLLAEIVGLVCADAGNASLGKGIQLLATSVILWLSTPLFEQLIELVEDILGAI